MKFLSLNVRGIRKHVKCRLVKELCGKEKVEFLGLQETMFAGNSEFVSKVRSIWGIGNFDFFKHDSVGQFGGLICAWDMVDQFGYEIFIGVSGYWEGCPELITIVNVYALQDERLKGEVWRKIFGS